MKGLSDDKEHADSPGAHGTPDSARAYIKPLAEHQMPRLPRKLHAESLVEVSVLW